LPSTVTRIGLVGGAGAVPRHQVKVGADRLVDVEEVGDPRDDVGVEQARLARLEVGVVDRVARGHDHRAEAAADRGVVVARAADRREVLERQRRDLDRAPGVVREQHAPALVAALAEHRERGDRRRVGQVRGAEPRELGEVGAHERLGRQLAQVPRLVLDEARGDADEGAVAVGQRLEVHRQQPPRRGEHVRVDRDLLVLVDRLVREHRREGPTRQVLRVRPGPHDVARAVVVRVAVVGVHEPAADAIDEVLHAL
jgi:hypothetical protein